MDAGVVGKKGVAGAANCLISISDPFHFRLCPGCLARAFFVCRQVKTAYATCPTYPPNR